jgi:hypothetical protein
MEALGCATAELRDGVTDCVTEGAAEAIATLSVSAIAGDSLLV